ncbi:hypothetical protein YC2023_032065 [Brassica napus]
MMKFGESAARIERSDGSVTGLSGGATEFDGSSYSGCEGYRGYGNREVSRNVANRMMQRDQLVTQNYKATAEQLDSVEKQIATIGEDSSAVMGIVTVPVFPDVDLRQWISWMEHYFARKGLTDFEKLHMAFGFIVDEAERYIIGIDSLTPIRNWKHMKEMLLLKFGADDDPEKMILNAESHRSYNGHHVELPVFDGVNPESWIVQADMYYSHQNDDYKLGMISLNLSGTVRSWLAGMLRRKKIKNWADFKQQLLAQFDPAMSCSAVDVKDESIILSEGVHETEVEKHSTAVEAVSLTSVAEVHQKDLVCEIVPETVMVKQTVSCDLVAGVQQKELNHAMAQETNMLIKKDSLAATDQEMDLHCENGHVSSYHAGEVSQKADSVVSNEVVHEIEESAEQTEEKLQMPQAWTAISKLTCVKRNRGSHKWEQGKCVKTWKFKFKNMNLQDWYNTMHWRKMRQPHMPGVMFKRQMKRTLLGLKQFAFREEKFQVKHKWRFRKLPHTFLLSFGVEQLIKENASELFAVGRRITSRLDQRQHELHRHTCNRVEIVMLLDTNSEVELWLSSVAIINGSASSVYSSGGSLRAWVSHDNIHRAVFENKHETSKRKRDRVALLCIRLMKLEAICWTQFTLGDINFHLEQRGAVWLWVCSDFSMAVADTRPEWQRSLIIFLYPSLRASLFSRVGVYESILICLWIVAVLIWRDDKEEKVESELLIPELLQIRVSSFLNCLLPQEKDLLLMHHEDNLIRVRVQQSYKKKKSLKTYMFKYKQLLRGVWPDIQQFNVQRAYRYVTIREEGNVQGRDNGRLWSGCYVHSGKVRQRRRRSKRPKSWMFKYKESASSFFSSSKLVGKLVFMGEVLIDFYYIGSDVASDDADVFNEEESGEPWFGAEGLLLQA